MFAVNGPTGPTSRHERRVRDDRPTKEQLEAQRKARENFFSTAPQAASTGRPSKTNAKPSRPLAEQENAGAPQIFRGCRIYFNGRTGNVSSYYLTKLVQEHGGNMAREYKVTRVTHIVACNLSAAKADKLMKSCGKIKCVRPEWILQSVKEGKKLPEFEFLVYKDASERVLSRAFTPTSGHHDAQTKSVESGRAIDPQQSK